MNASPLHFKGPLQKMNASPLQFSMIRADYVQVMYSEFKAHNECT